MTAPVPFSQPVAGDVVLCRFPEDLRKPRPGPKPRPGIVLKVLAPTEALPLAWRVDVCYATSNRARLYPHEFEITQKDHPHEYRSAGLSSDTKFDLSEIVRLPYTDEWFAIPASPLFGGVPKLGTLHALSVGRLSEAYRKARK